MVMLRRYGMWVAVALTVLPGEPRLCEAAGSPLRAGAFAQDITPPRFPISVNGGMSDHFAKGAHDPLHARCLVLANDDTQLAIVVVDSCMVPREIIDSARKRAAYRTGIPAGHILVSATHAHSCPTVGGVFQSDPDADYQLFLADRIADGIERAAKQLEPAKIGWAVAENPHQLFNRRWKLKDGILGENPFGQKVDRVRMNPGYSNPDVTESAGPIDPQVSVLAVQSRDGRPIAVLANYSLHYVGGVPGDVLSADYYGEFSQRIVRLIGAMKTDPPCVGMMSNGTSGDVNNVNYSLTAGPRRQPFEQIGIVAESVAQTAYAAYQSIQYDEAPVLGVREAEVDLGVRLPTADDVAQARQWLTEAGSGPYRDRKHIYARETLLLAEYPAKVIARLQAIRIGDLGIVSSPCETFTETGLAIKSQSPLKHTFTIELANGYNGYLPTPQQHEWGGYETWRARSSYLSVDAEPTIRETLLRLLQEVAN
jgi:neutral ceramidase